MFGVIAPLRVATTETSPAAPFSQGLKKQLTNKAMRSELEMWEKGLLCSLWHRVELDLMDNHAKTPTYLLRVVKRRLEEMQWEVRPTISPGQGATGPIRSERKGMAPRRNY